MFLSNNGKYFFDKDMKNEYTITFHEKIVKIFSRDINYPHKSEYSEKINNIEFNFVDIFNEISVSNNFNQIAILRDPIKVSVKLAENQIIKIDVFSLEQFEKILT